MQAASERAVVHLGDSVLLARLAARPRLARALPVDTEAAVGTVERAPRARPRGERREARRKADQRQHRQRAELLSSGAIDSDANSLFMEVVLTPLRNTALAVVVAADIGRRRAVIGKFN